MKGIPAFHQLYLPCGHTLFSEHSPRYFFAVMKHLLLSIVICCMILYASGQLPGRPAPAGRPSSTDSLFTLKVDTTQLSTVVVRAGKPLLRQQPFGMVLNVESSLLSKGSSAMALLERSPGVMIDHRNDNITLNGKNGVLIMIDGKPMRMPLDQLFTLLNGMNADDIDRIELFSTPPANFDAEGSAGLINIVLKKNKKAGTNGAISLTGGYGKGEKGTASLNLAQNKKTVDLRGAYSFSRDRSVDDLSGTSNQDFPPLGGQMNVLFWNNTAWTQSAHNASAGLDIRLNPQTTAGASMTYNTGSSSSTAYNRRIFDVFPDSVFQYHAAIQGTNRWTNMTGSLYLQKLLSEKERINVNMDYLSFKKDNPTAIQSSFDPLPSTDQQGNAHSLIRVGIAQADYSNQWSRKLKIDAGVKGSYTHNTSFSNILSLQNGSWISNPETTNDIIMQETIGAAYASVDAQLTAATNVVIGARYEYTYTHLADPTTKTTTLERRLGIFFPSIFVSHKLNEKASWQFSYTKRISRPAYDDLSPFLAYNDPVSVLTGNPYLRPTISNTLKLGYIYQGYSFSVLAGRDDYPIARWQLTASPSGDLMYISPQNLSWQNNLTFQLNIPWKPFTWWDMTYNLVGGWKQFKETYTALPAEKTYFSYSFNFNQSFKLPKRFSAELSGWYNAASYNGTVKNGAVGTLNAGIRKELKNNGGAFQLTISDVLRSIHYDSEYGSFTKDAFAGKSHVTFNPESRRARIVRLSYTRSFGAAPSKEIQSPQKP
jgi:outer membrane receptor protein involved in Fe transport